MRKNKSIVDRNVYIYRFSTLVSSSTTRSPSPEMCRTPLTGRRLEFCVADGKEKVNIFVGRVPECVTYSEHFERFLAHGHATRLVNLDASQILQRPNNTRMLREP